MTVVIFINFAGLKMLLGAGLGKEVDDLIAPPVIAAILSTLIRHKHFFAFQLNYNSIEMKTNWFKGIVYIKTNKL